MNEYHPNTLEFLRLTRKLDWNRWWKNHPQEDIGQYVRRRCEEMGNEEGDVPSECALTILRILAGIYQRGIEYEEYEDGKDRL